MKVINTITSFSVVIGCLFSLDLIYNRLLRPHPEYVALRKLAATTAATLPSSVVASKQVHKFNSMNSSSFRPCGKICFYEWDDKEEGKYYPLLYKDVNCLNIFHRMAHSPYPVVLPPPRTPPPQLLRNFTIDGQCPVSFYRYFDDSSGGKKPAKMTFNAAKFLEILEHEKVKNINPYRDRNVLKPTLVKYKYIIHGKRVAVVGTEKAWAEAMLLNLGASNITTIEYRELVIEHQLVTTICPYILAEHFIGDQGYPFDTVFSYSSLEHSGLGRYGDPITPFGDFEAIAQIWCMVKPGGHLLLTLPVSKDRDECAIVWNANRVYGAVRLQHMTANWKVLDEIHTNDMHPYGAQRMYILQKTTQV